MKVSNIYFSIYIIVYFILFKLLLLLTGYKHFYNAPSNEDNSIYIRNLLEDVTIIGFVIMCIFFLR